MPKELTWTDSEDIGILLSEAHPEVDPLAVRFTDLHKYVVALPSFKDDPQNQTNRNSKPSRWPGIQSFLTARRARALVA